MWKIHMEQNIKILNGEAQTEPGSGWGERTAQP